MIERLPPAAVMGLAVVLGLVAGLLVSLGTARSSPAAAQEDPPVRVVELDGVLEEEGRVGATVAVRNDGPEPLEELRVRLSVHEVTRSRFALSRAVDDAEPGPVRAVTESGGEELASAGEATLRIRATADDLGLDGASPGVYPATITVQHAAGTAAEYVTALVVPPPGGEPLRVSVLLEFRSPVALRDGAPYDPSAIASSVHRAQRLTQTLHTPFPATIALDGRSIDELRAAAEDGVTLPPDTAPPDGDDTEDAPADWPLEARDALDALAEIAARPDTEIVPFPYGPADLVALIRAGMGDEAQHLVDRGRAVADGLAGEDAAETSMILPARGLDSATAGWLSGVAGGTVLTEAELGLSLDRDLPETPSSVRTLAGIPGLRVAVPDPLLDRVLSRTDPRQEPALTAQRVLAETAAMFFERPGSSTPRGVLIRPSLARVPELVPALAEVWEAATWLEAVTLSTLVADVLPAPQPQALGYDSRQQSTELPPEYLAAVAEARSTLPSLEAVLGEDAVSGIDRRLDTASAVGFRRGRLRPHGEATAQSVISRIEGIRRAVDVLDGPPLTITGTEGAMPITLRSDAEVPLHVRVRVVTPRYAVDDEDGRMLDLPPGDEITTTFDVEALAPGGTYPVLVEITDPAGRMELASGRVTVRSTAFSVTGVTITGGAALFLVGWAIHGLLRRRGGSRAAETGSRDVDHEPAAAPPGGGG